MFGSIVATLLLVAMCITKDPTYAIAAGLFNLSSVIYDVTRPRRLKEVKPYGNTDGSSGG